MCYVLIMSIGVALRAIRKERGLSQAELADKAGTTSVSISRIEQGHQDPTFTMLERLAKAMGISANSLVRRAEKGEGRGKEA